MTNNQTKTNQIKVGQQMKYMVSQSPSGEMITVKEYTPATRDNFGDVLTPATITFMDNFGNRCWDSADKFKPLTPYGSPEITA